MSGTCSTRSDIRNAHEVLVRKPQRKEIMWRQHVDKILKCLTETLCEVVKRTAVEMSKPPAPDVLYRVSHYTCSRRSGSTSNRIYTDGVLCGEKEFGICCWTLQNHNNIKLRFFVFQKESSVFGTTPTTSGSLPLCLPMQYKCYTCKSNCCHYSTHNACACFWITSNQKY